MFPIAVNFSAGVRVVVIEPVEAADPVEAVDPEAVDEPDAEALDELSLEVAAADAVVVVDDVLSPLLSPTVSEAVSQAARKNVAAKSGIRR